MPEYTYWATTEIGDTVTGRLNASSPDEAAHLLTLRGFVVQRLEEASAAAETTPAAEAVSIPSANFVDATADAAMEATVPLSASLRALAQESTGGIIHRELQRMVNELDRGQPLDVVMRTFPTALPRRMSALVDAGLKTGKLPFFMQHVLDYQRRNAQLRRRILRNLAYPLLVFVFAASIVAGILIGIIPSFKKIFDDFGTDLPALTKVLIAVSDSAVGATAWMAPVAQRLGWPATIVLLCCVVAGASLLLGWFRIAPLDWLRHWSQRGLQLAPIVGSVFQTAALANFFRLVALLVEAGVPLPESLRLAAAVTDDGSLEAGAKRVSTAIEHGDSPLDAVRSAETFPREVLPIFRWADNRKLFIEALRGAADIYAVRSHLHAGVTGIVLAPALIFGVGLSVGLVVIAMFLPLIKLLNDLA